MTHPDLSIGPLGIPASLDAPDAADFLRYAAFERQICEEETGIAELSHTADDLLPRWRQQIDHRRTGYVARVDEHIVGAATATVSRSEGADAVEFDLLIPRAQWGQGVEDALLAAVEDDARRWRMPVLQTWTLHRPEPGDRPLTPQTGWGQVPATDLSDLLEGAGYRLEQVERTSAFDLGTDPALLRARRDEALRFAGEDYRLVRWTPPTPPEFRAGYADLRARMDTDMPSGELETHAARWDADRVARWDQLFLDSGEHLSVVAVQHVPTGELVAFNELVVGVDRSASTHQLGTLVRGDHRGRRLGTIVKCEGLLHWQQEMPASPRVLTYNAEENRPMLDVNEAVGFVPVAAAAGWQKRLDV